MYTKKEISRNAKTTINMNDLTYYVNITRRSVLKNTFHIFLSIMKCGAKLCILDK